jgi:predicted transposase YbfD/YdcC
VSAYAPALVAVMDQLETAGKGQEMAAAQLLLGTLPLQGRLVTADALHTQREFCQIILDAEGDYLVPVKENQPTLLADLEAVFSPATAESGGEQPGAERG